MAPTRLLLALLLILPVAGHAAAQDFEEDGDYPWPADRGHVLTWATAGCDETLQADADIAAAHLNRELERRAVYLRFHHIGHLEAMPELDEYADPQLGEIQEDGGAYLLTTAIARKAGADIVIGCVTPEVFAAANGNRTDHVIFMLPAIQGATSPDGDPIFVRRAAVSLIIRGQAIPVADCVDPVPVGHALRQASIQLGLLSGAGLGGRNDDPADVYGSLDSENKSCSAWFVPPPRTMSGETRDRLRALWGRDPGPGFAATVAGSMREHPVTWTLIPLAIVLAAATMVLVSRTTARTRARNPHGVVRRDPNGRAAEAPATMFRPGEGFSKAPRDPYAPADFSDLADSGTRDGPS